MTSKVRPNFNLDSWNLHSGEVSQNITKSYCTETVILYRSPVAIVSMRKMLLILFSSIFGITYKLDFIIFSFWLLVEWTHKNPVNSCEDILSGKRCGQPPAVPAFPDRSEGAFLDSRTGWLHRRLQPQTPFDCNCIKYDRPQDNHPAKPKAFGIMTDGNEVLY